MVKKKRKSLSRGGGGGLETHSLVIGNKNFFGGPKEIFFVNCTLIKQISEK